MEQPTDKQIQAEKAKITAIFKKKKGDKSYYSISQKSGLTPQQIKSIEQGKQYTVDSLMKLCSAFNCTLKIDEK